MYAFIEGKVMEASPAHAVLENHGIGYFLNISLQTYSSIKDAAECRLYTHLVVREDALLLFGFFDQEERRLFRELITVSGIGANTARLLLSSLSTAELTDAIVGNHIHLLQSVKGIGSKTAQRIVVDLKDKLSRVDTGKEIMDFTYNTNKDAALSGLTMLGFNKKLADKTLDKILNDPRLNLGKPGAMSVEELIRQALKLL
ncbi:MAG TPA: Holliday junction branch migration protein RuvA [Bacteroidales bacterium]|nr:Holliday junction branch migration protein RuvA [Bacteroidales bacterium]HRZ20139.1 Holliday junction branch migration protein RuvA [Bacteroidales bacterium]